MTQPSASKVSPASETSAPTGGSAGSPRARRWLFRLFVLGLAFALSVALVEAALWIIAPIRYHEWVIYEDEGHIRCRLMPNQVVHTAAGYPVRVNKHGFRGPDYAWEKKPGTLRICVFGGSAGFCYHAAGEEKTWPGALQVKLHDRLDMPVEIINLSLPGFDAFNSKINYLCWGRGFKPDAILVYHTWNDMKEFRRQETEPYHRQTYSGNMAMWQRVARHTQIGRRARNFIWTVTRRGLENKYVPLEGTGVDMDRPISDKAFAWERQNFLDFANWSKLDGVLPILVSQANLGHPDNLDQPGVRFTLAAIPEMCGMTLALAVDTWVRVGEIIEEVARETGAIFVDGYDAVPHDLDHFPDSVHLLDPGNEKLAEAIADVLVDDPRFKALVEKVKSETAPGE